MPHHQTRSTVSASYWCNKCQKQTQHRIYDRRKGACIPCADLAELEHAARMFAYEERAALKEFLGNMSREQAEREAYEEVFGVKKQEQEKLW